MSTVIGKPLGSGHSIRLGKVLKSCLPSTSHRHAGEPRNRMLRREERKERVVQYVGENARRSKRVYVWGLATTGALGIRSYLKPEKQQKPILEQHRPAYLRFLPQHEMQPYLAACGYGFTVYGVKARRQTMLLGTGINTNSQLGYHEMPRNSGRILDYVVEPAVIPLPLDSPHSTRVVLAACGRAHTVLVTDSEGVFSLGNNAYGQCGRPIVELEDFRGSTNVNRLTDLPEISQVVCGQDHTIFVSKTGEVFSCGLGADGQTGQGHYKPTGKIARVTGDIEGERIVTVASRGDTVLALSDKGDVFGWGNSEYGQLSSVTDATQVAIATHLPLKHCGKVVKVATGGSSCALLNERGQVYVWGFGLLGQGPAVNVLQSPSLLPEPLFGRNELNPNSRVVDIQAGLFHFAAITDTGDLYTWGKNKHGCLGLGKAEDQTFPLKVSLPAEAYEVHCGVDHMVVLSRSFS